MENIHCPGGSSIVTRRQLFGGIFVCSSEFFLSTGSVYIYKITPKNRVLVTIDDFLLNLLYIFCENISGPAQPLIKKQLFGGFL